MAKTANRTAKKSIYSVHPGVTMVQKWMAESKPKTGRTLAEWLRLIKKEGPPTEEERREWLKTKYGLGTNTAWWFAERSVGKGEETGDAGHYLEAAEKYVEEMFSGTTQTRIDLGLSLGNIKTSKRLIDTGGNAKKDRITHRIEITSLKDIDDEVKRWLKVAYDQDA